ncbi:MAG TPA: universal stress protein [Candidatus Binatia bacterium]|jgi:nucleotide-binding universal stress UspA family protein
MYSKILVPLDGSTVAEQVLPYARFLAARLKVPVELLGVVDPAAIAVSGLTHNPRYVGKLTEEGRRASESYLARVSQAFSEKSVTRHVEIGNPAGVIIDRAAQDKSALVAMATHGRTGMSRWLLGSVAEKVLRGGTNPLLLVRAGVGGRGDGGVEFEFVIVPLDTSPTAEAVLYDVVDLAKLLDLKVILMHAYEIPLSAYYGAEDYSTPNYRNLAAHLRDEGRKYLDGKVEDLKRRGLAKVSSVLLEGSAAEEIIALTRNQPNSFVAISTHGYSGVKRWMLGSVTEKVARHCDDPVLVVRAE